MHGTCIKITNNATIVHLFCNFDSVVKCSTEQARTNFPQIYGSVINSRRQLDDVKEVTY